MIECTRILFSLTDSLVRVLHLEELETTLASQAHFVEPVELMAGHEPGYSYNLAVLECENTDITDFIAGLDALLNAQKLPFSRFILVSREPLTADLSQAWQLGMHCYVCVSLDNKSEESQGPDRQPLRSFIWAGSIVILIAMTSNLS